MAIPAGPPIAYPSIDPQIADPSRRLFHIPQTLAARFTPGNPHQPIHRFTKSATAPTLPLIRLPLDRINQAYEPALRHIVKRSPRLLGNVLAGRR
jgi:hypothetical protein